MLIAHSIAETATRTIEDSKIAGTRLVLASAALLIFYLDPAEPDHLFPLTYSALILHAVYSAVLYSLALNRSTFLQYIRRWSHWIDVGWYLVLIGLSSGASSIFFFFFFFPILVASFRWGFWPGLRVVIVSAVLFTAVGYLTAPRGPAFELNRFFLRPVYLLALGYMMAYWGGFELKLKKQLALLKEVSALSNPRFGVDRTLGMIMERVLAFYNAGSCLLITLNLDSSEHHIRRADDRNPESGVRAEFIDTELAQRMISLPPGYAVVYNGERRWWRRLHKNYYAFDVAKGSRADEGRKESRMLTDLLDAKSFVTIPLGFRGEIAGRFYVTAQRPQAFDPSDADFLLQIFDHVFPVLDNIRLVDRLASDAAEAERQRIARNIHDSVIQPYLGLQIGLTTVRQRLAESVAGETGSGGQLAETVANMVSRIERLIEMTNAGINDLRRYVSGLKETDERKEGLLSAVRRFAARFEEATGITVEVEAVSDVILNDRLAAEAFQMVVEGLSNIRRHTHSGRARVELVRHTGLLILRIENDSENGPVLASFTPRSISERAESLGGRAQVEQSEGRTIVTIEVPL